MRHHYPLRWTLSAKLLPMATDADDENIPGIDRLLALTDGVVAIALTLLVLQLQVPVTHALEQNPDSAKACGTRSTSTEPEITSYLVSFVVIAQFWIVHHRVLRSMRGHSEGLAWRNFGFLLALTLMPFTSDLIGRYGSNPVAVTLFGLNLVAISLTTQWIFLYAAGHNLMIDAARSAHDERAARVRVGDGHRHRHPLRSAGLDRPAAGEVRLVALPRLPVGVRADRPLARTLTVEKGRGRKLDAGRRALITS